LSRAMDLRIVAPSLVTVMVWLEADSASVSADPETKRRRNPGEADSARLQGRGVPPHSGISSMMRVLGQPSQPFPTSESDLDGKVHVESGPHTTTTALEAVIIPQSSRRLVRSHTPSRDAPLHSRKILFIPFGPSVDFTKSPSAIAPTNDDSLAFSPLSSVA
jgi:hypothetical protein